jgi:uncharacterized protein
LKTFANWLIEKRRVLFVVTLVLVVFFGFFTKNLRMDNSVGIWFLEDDPAFQAYRDFQNRFGNDDVVTLFFSAPEGVFTPENLALIRRVSLALEEIPYVDRVISLSHVKYMDASDPERLVLENLYEGEPSDAAQAARVRERVDAWPAVEDLLLNQGRDGTLIMAELKVIENIDAIRGEVIQAVEKAVGPLFAAANKPYRMGGIGVIYNALNQAAILDSAVFTSLSYAAIFVCLILFLASLRFALLAMGVLFLSMTLTLGIFACAGNSINMVTMILPTLILVIGIEDMVHVLVTYTRCLRSSGTVTREEAMRETLHHMLVPCILTSVTTAFGFIGLAYSPMAVLRQFGLYAALGVLVTWVLTFVIAVFVCMKIAAPTDKPRRAIFEKLTAGLDRGLQGMARAGTERPGTIIGISLVLLLAGLWGIRYLEANTYPVRYLNEKDPVRVSHEVIEKDFGFFIPLEFSVRVANEDGVKNPAFLEKLREFQDALARDPEIKGSFSVVDIVEFLNRAFHEGRAEDYRIPGDAATVSQLLEFYQMDAKNDLEEWVGPDFREARVTAYTKTLSANEYGRLTARAREIFRQVGFDPRMLDGEGLRAEGYIPLYVVMNNYILESQVASFVIAFVLVFGLLGLIFRSVRLFAACLFPNVLPVVLMLGFMGFAGITLDIGTVMIAAVMLGIVVDDTIHFLYRFRREALGTPDVSDRIRATLREAGPAVVTTCVILASGFLILGLASIQSIANFGILSAVTLVVALFCDLLLLPSLLMKMYR